MQLFVFRIQPYFFFFTVPDMIKSQIEYLTLNKKLINESLLENLLSQIVLFQNGFGYYLFYHFR